MIRTLLATTALAALLSTGAIAQDTAPAADPAAPATTTEAPATDAGATPVTADPAAATSVTEGVDTGAVEETDVNEPWDMSAGYVAADTDNLGSRLIDQPVYSSAGDDAEEIGNITDIVFDEDGQITAVVIGVGGFLGIGEKAVAVDFGSLEFTLAADNTERWVLPTTAEALTAAPDFVWEEDEPADVNNDAAAPADNATAPATDATGAMAPATDNAMAPAADANANAAAPMAMPREGFNDVEVDTLTADNLTGATVVGPDGNDIATVGDLLLSQDGQIDAMLIDVGGFLGIGQKTVAVGMENLEFASNENGDLLVYSDFTREQLEAAPEYDEATYASDPTLRTTDQ